MRAPSYSFLAWRPWSSWSTAFGPAGKVLGRKVQFRIPFRTAAWPAWPQLLPSFRRGRRAVGSSPPPTANNAALVAELTIRTGLFSELDDCGSPVDADECDVVFEHRRSGVAAISRSPSVLSVPTVTSAPAARAPTPEGTSLRRMKDRRGRAMAIGAFFLTGDGRALTTPRARDVSALVNSLDVKDGARPTLRQLAWVAAARGLLPARRGTRGHRSSQTRVTSDTCECDDATADDDDEDLQLRVTLTDLRELEFTAADGEIDLRPA